MAVCDKCAAQVPDGAVFCDWCGNRLISAVDVQTNQGAQQGAQQFDQSAGQKSIDATTKPAPETPAKPAGKSHFGFLSKKGKKPSEPTLQDSSKAETKPEPSKEAAPSKPAEKKEHAGLFHKKKAAAPAPVVQSPTLESKLQEIKTWETGEMDSRLTRDEPLKDKDSKKGFFHKKGKKDGDKGEKSEGSKYASPYSIKKKSPTSEIMIPLIIGVIILVVVGVLLFTMSGPSQPAPSDCVESWSCGDWSACEGGFNKRSCVDANACGTLNGKPMDTFACSDVPVNNTTALINETKCSELGRRCATTEDCCNGSCLHYFCRENGTVFCGDGYCDTGETCTSCSYDCGSCARHRDLEQNVFTEPLGYLAEKPIKEDDYVIVRYFYSNDCVYCENPVNIDLELREMASEFKDIFALITINAVKYKDEADKYARVGGSLFVPFIRVEGFSNGTYGYNALYSNTLGQKLQDGDIKADVAEMICKRSDYCDFIGGKMVRIYNGSVVEEVMTQNVPADAVVEGDTIFEASAPLPRGDYVGCQYIGPGEPEGENSIVFYYSYDGEMRTEITDNFFGMSTTIIDDGKGGRYSYSPLLFGSSWKWSNSKVEQSGLFKGAGSVSIPILDLNAMKSMDQAGIRSKILSEVSGVPDLTCEYVSNVGPADFNVPDEAHLDIPPQNKGCFKLANYPSGT